jgi:anti-sigma B factor antagonist
VKWTEEICDGVVVLRLSGEVDLASSPDLRALLQSKAKARCRALVIDMAGLTYIESSGLATLVEYYRDAHAFGGRFALAGMSDRVRTIFDLTRLGEVIEAFPTLADAQATLPPKPPHSSRGV